MPSARIISEASPSMRYYSDWQVKEFEESKYLPKFAEVEPRLEIGNVLTKVFKADEVKEEGKKRADKALVSVCEKMKSARTKDDAIKILEYLKEEVKIQIRYLMQIVRGKCLHLVQSGAMQAGKGTGGYRAVTRGNSCFFNQYQKQADNLAESATRLSFVHPEVLATGLLVLRRVCTLHRVYPSP